MSLSRRSVLQGGAVAAAAALSIGVRLELALPPDALLVFDGRLPQSRALAVRHAGLSVDLARERANLWRTLRGLRSGGRVAGLTGWSDFVQVRGLLAEGRRRVRAEARCGRLFYWEMA